MRRSFIAFCLAICLPPWWLASAGNAEELRLSAARIATTATFENLELSKKSNRLKLIRGMLIENDGDAAGFSYRPNEEVLKEGVTAHKHFDLTRMPNPD